MIFASLAASVAALLVATSLAPQSVAFQAAPSPVPYPTPGLVATPQPSAMPTPAPEHRSFVGSDGALHYPIDARGRPQLTCMPLFVCDIALEAGETVLNIAAGDTARWLIAPAQSGAGGVTPHILVKPTALDLFTNLVVTTSRRVYDIYLRAARTTTYSRLEFWYPDDEAAAQASAERAREAARVADVPLQPDGAVDRAFRKWGDAALLPAVVYADTTHTFIAYAQLPQDLPVLFAVTPDGNDQIVNYRVKGTVFIVDGAQRDFDLVLDAGTGRHGSGERRAHVRHL